MGEKYQSTLYIQCRYGIAPIDLFNSIRGKIEAHLTSLFLYRTIHRLCILKDVMQISHIRPIDSSVKLHIMLSPEDYNRILQKFQKRNMKEMLPNISMLCIEVVVLILEA